MPLQFMIDYNVPETWITEEIHNEPTHFDKDAYQVRVNSICGLNPLGKPNVQVSWMPSPENFQKYYSEWNEAGFGTAYYLRATYCYQTFWEGTRPLDVPAPRWALKQWQSGAQYAHTDEQIRWKKRNFGGVTEYREVRPAHPEEGRYIPLISIGKHNEFCCPEAKREGVKCWGAYRVPDETHLTLLSKAVKEREAENGQNPNEPISAETLRRAAVETVREQQRKDAEKDEFMDAYLDEHLPDILARITGDKSFREVKPFSYGYKKGNNGLVLPNN